MGGSAGSLEKVKVKNIRCSPFMCWASNFFSWSSGITNPCCLLMISFLPLVCLEAVFRRSFSIAFPGVELRLSSAIPCILLLALVEDRNDETLASLQSSGIYPDLHNPSEIIMDSHTMALVYPLSSSHIRPLIFRLFECSPTRSSSPKDKSRLLQSFSLEKSGVVVKVSFLQQRHYRWKGGADTFFHRNGKISSSAFLQDACKVV